MITPIKLQMATCSEPKNQDSENPCLGAVKLVNHKR